MKVQEVILSNGEKRYLVINDSQQPIKPIMLFMKYLDSIQRSPNTQRAYYFGLRDFFVYLSLTEIHYKSVTIKVIANFLAWLVNPTLEETIPYLSPPNPKTERTINLRITAVMSFYKFLYQFDYIDQDLAHKAYEDVKGVKKYKDFLYHINRSKVLSKSIFKLKEPRKKIKIIPDNIIKSAFEATTNRQLIFEICFYYPYCSKVD